MILTSNDDNSNENVYCIILWNNGIFIKDYEWEINVITMITAMTNIKIIKIQTRNKDR